MNPYDVYLAGLQGAEQGKRRGLASLMGKAFNAPPEQRQQVLGQIAQVDGPSAFDAQKHFDGMDDDARTRLGRDLAVFDTLPDEQKASAYPQIATKAQQLGIPVSPTWNPEFAPHMQKLAQVLGGVASGSNVQSRFVGEDGQVYALMRNGSVQPLGIKADPSMQIIEGEGGYFGVNKRNLKANPVQIGQMGEQPQPQTRPPPGGRQVIGPDGRPLDLSGIADPRMRSEIEANPALWQVAPDGAEVRMPEQTPTGGGQLRPAAPQISPYQQEQLSLQRDKLAAAQAARDQATAARKAADDAKAAAKSQAAGARQAESATSASELISAIDTLTKHDGFKSLGTPLGDLQINAPLVRNAAKDANAQLKNIGGQVALATMNRLKALSSQGATGFGALSQSELTLLQNSIATLQSEDISNDQIKASLKVIRDKMQKIADWQGDASAPTQPGRAPLPAGFSWED